MAKRRLSEEKYKSLCKLVHQRDSWRCRNPQCRKRDDLCAHHIIFRSQQGEDISSNLVTLCNYCHKRVHGLIAGLLLTILAKSGDPDTTPNADVGLRFITQ